MIIRAKYGHVSRDYNMRKFFSGSELSKYLLKSMLQSNAYTPQFKLYFTKMFYLFKRVTAISRYSTSCSFSNSGRKVFRHFKLSRMFCKSFASHGFLLGMRKSSF